LVINFQDSGRGLVILKVGVMFGLNSWLVKWAWSRVTIQEIGWFSNEISISEVIVKLVVGLQGVVNFQDAGSSVAAVQFMFGLCFRQLFKVLNGSEHVQMHANLALHLFTDNDSGMIN
jgi:hypothetical protein